MVIKPRIVWVYYPKLKRGYWRVCAMPPWFKRAKTARVYWRYAYRMASQMNAEVVSPYELEREIMARKVKQ